MITFLQNFKNELANEAVGTRKMLALVPADKLDFAPHIKSMKLKPLATHIADLPSWVEIALNTDELDLNTAIYNPDDCTTPEEFIAFFDKQIQKAFIAIELAETTGVDLEKQWLLRQGEIIYMTSTKHETVRHAINQLIHHRAQLGVYLRLLNISIPGVYGPSADEQ